MFHFDPQKVYSMPPYFGGADYNPASCSTISKFTQLQFIYQTDKCLLCNYIPESFVLLSPEITLSYCEFHEVSFLNGSAYNVMQLSVPVAFQGKQDHINGILPLVIWENRTIPICGGREESGMPKIPAGIEDFRINQNIYSGAISYEGKNFLKVSAKIKNPMTSYEIQETNQESQQMNIFGWRYIPNVGKSGPALSQPILYPQAMTLKKGWHCTGSFQWFPLTTEELQSQAHIIQALSNLPICKMKQVQLATGSLRLCPSLGKVLQ